MSTTTQVLRHEHAERAQRAAHDFVHVVVPLLLPFVILLVQLALWRYLQPFAWVLFYPAVIASSWLGGLRHGLVATFVSAALVWWFFVPPEHTFVKDPDRLIPATMYLGLGAVTAFTHAHVRKANVRMRAAMHEQRIFAAFIDNSSDFIGIVDTTGTPRYLNPAGRRLVGMAADYSLETTRITDFYPPALRTSTAAAVASLGASDHWESETSLRNWTTGETIPVSQVRFVIREPKSKRVLGLGTIARDITERRRLERALGETSAALARAQSVAAVGSWRLDVRRNELLWSEESYRLFGIPQGTPMTYEAFLACVHPDDRAYVERSWAAALEGAPYDIEHRIVVRGETRWIREKAELEFEDGTLLGGVGIAQDLTERKRLEEELRLSEARASGIVSISADAFISVDEDQRITLFNEGAERIFGYSKAEALGAPLDLLLPERSRAVHREHVAGFAAGAEVARRMGERTAAITGIRKNGEEFPAAASISKLDIGGKRILTVAVRDITEEKRVDTEQRFFAEVGSVLTSTLDYEQTVTNIVQLAVRDLADFCIVDLIEISGELRRFRVGCRDPASEWICDVLARVQIDRKQPYLTGAALDTMRPALLQEISPEMIASFARNEEHAAALRAMNARSAIVAPLVARSGLLGAIGVVSSGTSRRYGARDIALVEELARRAALSVENARLYRAARAAIQSRDDVMGIVAHDLRNPLNTINLHAMLLATHDVAKEPAGAIRRASQRMNRIIQDLLDVTRMEAGRLPLDRVRTHVESLVADVVTAQRPLALAAGLELRHELGREIPAVWADRDRVFQIFENLVGNAVKFTSRGGTVTIGASARENEVLFWVADSGAGIALEDQPHVFDRFWQARSTRRHGAGLGLPIVKGIVEAHGGRLWLESTPGRGTTFFFTLPAAVEPASEPS